MSAISVACQGCRAGRDLPFSISMAFQPIIHLSSGRVWAYEALVRGVNGEGAGDVLGMVDDKLIYAFDQACRVKAVELAGSLFDPSGDELLSINFMPNAVYEPNACIRATLEAAKRANFRQNRIMFEFTENERMRDARKVQNIIDCYKRRGFVTALDDFGAGYAGLNLLAELSPDVLKIDMALTRDIQDSASKRAIVAGVVGIASELKMKVVAEGIETADELACVQSLGIDLCQGFLFAKAAIAELPVPVLQLSASA
jgi:EAL domain-containing protein (putative c-di-GMP-specific phosphodiesterase class I)